MCVCGVLLPVTPMAPEVSERRDFLNSLAYLQHMAQRRHGGTLNTMNVWRLCKRRSPALGRLQSWEAVVCEQPYCWVFSNREGVGSERRLDSLPVGPCHALLMSGARCPDSFAESEAWRCSPRPNMSQLSFCFIPINSTSELATGKDSFSNQA